jgi:hypothetical protein
MSPGPLVLYEANSVAAATGHSSSTDEAKKGIQALIRSFPGATGSECSAPLGLSSFLHTFQGGQPAGQTTKVDDLTFS